MRYILHHCIPIPIAGKNLVRADLRYAPMNAKKATDFAIACKKPTTMKFKQAYFW